MSEQEYGTDDGSFQAAGGEVGIRRLVEAFYRIMDERADALTIRNMHPNDLAVSIDKFARFLCGWMGGPKLYAEKYGSIAIPPAHAHIPIGEVEKQAWLTCMEQALAEQDYTQPFKQYLMVQLAVPAGRIVAMQKNMQKYIKK
jgi:hemoglobin